MSRFLRSQIKGPKKGPSPLLLAILLLGFLLLLSSVISLVRKQIGIKRSIELLKIEQAALVTKQENLTETIEYLSTTDGKEQVLRDKYRLVKPGEGLVVITEPLPNTEAKITEKRSFFGRFFGAIERVFDRE